MKPAPWKGVGRALAGLPSGRRLTLYIGASAVGAWCLSAALFSIPALNLIEWRLADAWAAGSYGRRIEEKVAVVGIDEALFEEFEWPLEKDVYGDLISFLQEAGAEVIAFDILFSDNLYACGKGDSILRGMLRWFPNTVLGFGAVAVKGEGFSGRSHGKPVPKRFALGPGIVPGCFVQRIVLPYRELLACTRHIGAVNLAFPFPDGVDRRAPLFVAQDSLLYPSLGLAAAALHTGQDKPAWDKARGRLRLGNREIWVDRRGHVYPDFSTRIPFYRMSDIRDAHARMLLGGKPGIGREQLRGRIVFVGNSAPSLGDLGTNPVSEKESGGRSPNVMMHARTAASILAGTELRRHGRPAALCVSALLVPLLALLFRFLPMQYSLVLSFMLMGACLPLSRMLYLNGHFMPMVEATAAGGLFVVFGALGVYIEKDSSRRFLYTTFGKYVSPVLIEDMARNNLRPELGGEEVFGSAFFSDIEDFTRLSEGMSPMELITTLNEYFSTMTHLLLDNHGTLDKFIGDAIVAFFGAPRPSHHHARDACTAAVGMQEALARLRRKWHDHSSVPEDVRNLRMRIGINSGHFVTGNMGCNLRMNYTMLGDTVNLASRLEGAAKEYGIYTVVGEETRRLVMHDFLLRKVDNIRVKGRSRPEGIYQLMGKPRRGDATLRELIDIYEEALETYRRGNFVKARRCFGQALRLERFPDLKNPSRIMLDRTERLIKINPGQWDGVYTMERK